MDYVNAALLMVLGLTQFLLTKRLVSFVSAYGSKEGEIQAIQRNLALVVQQQQQQTEAVKGIEARITGSLWNEQERWSLRCETYGKLLEYWTACAMELRDALSTEQPDWSAYRTREKELERRPEYVRARALSHMVLSAPVLADLDEVDRAFSRVRFDERLWKPTIQGKARWQMLALTEMLLDSQIRNFAGVAHDDLAAFGESAQAAFTTQVEERRRLHELLDQTVTGKELSPQDAEWLSARLPPPIQPKGLLPADPGE